MAPLVAGALPDELRDHPEVVELYGRWLLRSLLVRFDADDLELLRAHLEEACEARTDTDSSETFGRGPRDDDWFRWRFSWPGRCTKAAGTWGSSSSARGAPGAGPCVLRRSSDLNDTAPFGERMGCQYRSWKPETMR